MLRVRLELLLGLRSLVRASVRVRVKVLVRLRVGYVGHIYEKTKFFVA